MIPWRDIGARLTDLDRAVLDAADRWRTAMYWQDPPTGNAYEDEIAAAEAELDAAVRARREANQ